jgi:16S rRNA G966 N2-methylase RsmD
MIVVQMLIEEQNGNFAKPVLGAVPFLNEIVNMDWKEAIKQVSDKSIDLVVTDPPYGMKFQSNYRSGLAKWLNPKLNRITKL